MMGIAHMRGGGGFDGYQQIGIPDFMGKLLGDLEKSFGI